MTTPDQEEYPQVPCDDCNATGKRDVLYSEVPGSGYGSCKGAAWLAGEVHHVEDCPACGGTKMVEDKTKGETQ